MLSPANCFSFIQVSFSYSSIAYDDCFFHTIRNISILDGILVFENCANNLFCQQQKQNIYIHSTLSWDVNIRVNGKLTHIGAFSPFSVAWEMIFVSMKVFSGQNWSLFNDGDIFFYINKLIENWIVWDGRLTGTLVWLYLVLILHI